MDVLGIGFAVLHTLVAATWFGAMSYSFAVLHPRALQFFGSDERGFEELMTFLAAGARWKVLGACAVLAASGVGLGLLVWARGEVPGTVWTALVLAKTALFLVTVGVFVHVSWRMWPARVFALPHEVPGHQRRFRYIAVALLVLVGTQIVLGVWATQLS